jgi:hypothetical protein
MPIGPFEKKLLQLIASNRNPESYVGGATVLNRTDDSPRTSEDIDVFHDSESSLSQGVDADVALLRDQGFNVEILLERPSFYRARISEEKHSTKMEWVQDSAFRFFPVQEDDVMGYRLHHWDAATNKVLAGAGRAVIRDYADLLYLHTSSLSLGALIWAAAAKDPGLNPDFIHGELMRVQRYDAEKYNSLKLTHPPDPVAWKKTWLQGMHEAKELIEFLFESDAPYGCFFLNEQGDPQTPNADTLDQLTPHFGSLRGCWPQIVEE